MSDWIGWSNARHLKVSLRWSLVATLILLVFWILSGELFNLIFISVRIEINSFLNNFVYEVKWDPITLLWAFFISFWLMYWFISSTRPGLGDPSKFQYESEEEAKEIRVAYYTALIIGFLFGLGTSVCIPLLPENTLKEWFVVPIIDFWLFNGFLFGVAFRFYHKLGYMRIASIAALMSLGFTVLLAGLIFGNANATMLIEACFVLAWFLGIGFGEVANRLNQHRVWHKIGNWLIAKPEEEK